MEELIAKLQEKAQACGYKTKEDRARKGAYVDCIMELKEALRIHAVSGSLGFDEGYKQGYNDATREACQEIAKNYQPNDH
jgi:alcohol dehydrogenase class IV